MADADIHRYKEDKKQRLLTSINEFEKEFTSKRARMRLGGLKCGILKEGGADSLREAMQRIEDKKLKEYERDVEFLYICRGIKDNPISQVKPRKQIKFKLWERKVMPSYLKDPHTDFFRILVNERRIGHVKMFCCIDEDGENVLHVDYIGLSGGRFKPFQEEIRRYAVTASIELAKLRGLKRVYIAQEIIPNLDGQPVRNRLAKKGQDIYSQYLEATKFLVWQEQQCKSA